MGLGKTITTIAAICALHRQHRGSLFVVVCPSSLVVNWSKEFDKWIGKAGQPKRVILQKGGDEGLSKLRAFAGQLSRRTTDSHVLIVSFDLLRRNASLLAKSPIRLMVVDEGHRLKNATGSLTLSALESLPTEARLLLTATPVQNNLTDFFTLANFCCPQVLGEDLASFRRDFERPILVSQAPKATLSQRRLGQAQAQRLDEISAQFMLRRLQKDILKSMLPARHEFLVFSQPTPHQVERYKELTSSLSTNNGSDALTILLQLRKLCLHPAIVSDDDDESQNGILHGQARVALSSKFQVLATLLDELREAAPNDKIVLVSNFTSALTLIEETILKPKAVPYLRLDGSTEVMARQALVDTFNRTSAQRSSVFLLSSKAGGCGLNLIGANRLVMVDPDWNPASDIQAMARVYRQGQTKECFIYRLFTTGTVEEVILQRQMQKGSIASRTVDKESHHTLSSFSKQDLRDCFTLKEGPTYYHNSCDTKQKVGSLWPNYAGPSSLEACKDIVLLRTLAKAASSITFVHHLTQETAQKAMANQPVQEHTNTGSPATCSLADLGSLTRVSAGDSDDSELEFEG